MFRPPAQLTILAPGLLGASVAMAARSRAAAGSIHVWARRPETRLEIEREDWCDAVHASPSEAVSAADLVLLCAPVDRIPALAAEIAPSLKADAIVTDVGSVKASLCRETSSALAGRARFIGSHPMAGSEKTGWRAATADLFEGRTCFVTPSADSDPAATEFLVRFWDRLGSRVATVSPDAHDEIVAAVSHLPHLAAVAVAATLGTRSPSWGEFSGNGLRDTTRIAAGDPELWRAILQDNRDEVLRSLRSLQDTLDRLHAALANGNSLALVEVLREAKRFRDSLPPMKPAP